MKKILIIEDDISIAELERDYLDAEGFEIEIIHNGAHGLEKALGGDFDLIILDLMLPHTDGFTICRRVRKETEIPILMVSARKEDIDKIRGLGLGADDYITKPFSPGELVARVKSHLNRYDRIKGTEKKNQSVSVRGLSVDYNTRKVLINDKEISLTGKEFDILFMLISNPGRVFTKEEIFEKVWVDTFGDMSTITVHVRKLREKIEYDPSNPQYIETVWGVGYRFSA
ncbi:MAG: response regulator transcription factor [Spirochaetaceae bacterium]|nr:response regulator transcription factor [Spirochaetaceae bacterium]